MRNPSNLVTSYEELNKDLLKLENNLLFLLQKVKSSLVSKLDTKRMKLEENKRTVELIDFSRNILQEAYDQLYESVFGKIAALVNKALKYVFYDKLYTFSFELSFERGNKVVDYKITDASTGEEVSVLHGIGNGIRTVVSFVLEYCYLKFILKDNPVIMIYDEFFSSLSDEYLSSFFAFVSRLDSDLYFVIVTHDSRLLDFANKSYSIVDGTISPSISSLDKGVN